MAPGGRMGFSFESGSALPDLPFRIVVLGPFCSESAPAGSAEAVHRLDGSSFHELLSRLAGTVKLELPGGGDPVRLRLDSLRSFRPEAIVRNLPWGEERLAARKLLEEVKNRRLRAADALDRLAGLKLPAGLSEPVERVLRGDVTPGPGGEGAGDTDVPSPPAAQAGEAAGAPSPTAGSADRLPPPSPAPAPEPDDALGGLLSMVDLPGGEGAVEGPGAGAADNRGSGAARPGAPGIPPGSAPPSGPAAAAMASIISSIVRPAGGATPTEAARADSALRVLDAGLAAEVRAVLAHPGFRRVEAAWRGLRFLLNRIDLRAGVVLEIRSTGAGGPEAALRDLAGRAAEAGESAEGPVGLVVGTEMIEAGEGLDRLATLAEAAASLGVPLVAGMTVAAAEALAADPGWAELRRREASRRLVLAVNPFLLRMAYGPDADPVAGLEFDEDGGAALWGSPALCVAVNAGRAFAEHGWPTHFEGAGQAIDSLPLPGPGGATGPLQAFPAQEAVRRLAAAGFTPLWGAAGRDEARLFLVPAVGEGASLATELAAGRVAAMLRRALAGEAGGSGPGLEARIQTVLKSIAPGWPDARVQEDTAGSAASGARRLKVTWRVGPPVLPAAAELNFGIFSGA